MLRAMGVSSQLEPAAGLNWGCLLGSGYLAQDASARCLPCGHTT
jgi:hypothetical protein